MEIFEKRKYVIIANTKGHFDKPAKIRKRM